MQHDQEMNICMVSNSILNSIYGFVGPSDKHEGPNTDPLTCTRNTAICLGRVHAMFCPFRHRVIKKMIY